MRITTGKVIGGKVVVEGTELPEGATVTVLTTAEDQAIEVTSEQEAELLEAIEQVERGEVVAGEVVLKAIQKQAS